MLLFIASFLAGILTVLAPCTLALLPVIIGSSVAGRGDSVFNLRKALVITVSLGVSVFVFTLLLKASTLLIHVPQSVWQIVSGVIILVFGLITLFPELWERIPFIAKLNVDSNKAIASGYNRNNMAGDVIIGAALGPVFSTCSPTYFVILATVLPQSLVKGLIDLLSYSVGLSIILFIVAITGQKLTSKLEGLTDTHGWFRRCIGLIFIIIGIIVIFGIDQRLETDLLNANLPDITSVEQKLLSHSQSRGTSAPEITDPSGFINTDGQPITIGQFKGKKVVLIDFWTYSCINCRRTLPYLKEWYAKYKDQGLEIIGIHTPEFAFEHIQSNVEQAVKDLGIEYPVVLDNDYATWNAFGNEYWPRKYLINADGQIVYDHIGEGGYDEMEKAIQQALMQLHQSIGESTSSIPTDIGTPADTIDFNSQSIGSPETYFGSNRNQYLADGVPGYAGTFDFSAPSSFDQNALYLDGTWSISPEYATNKGPSKIIYRYQAKNVYMVASSDDPNGVVVTIKEDGVVVKTLTIKAQTLYTLINDADYGSHTLEIDVLQGSLNAFTFTFG